MAVILVTGGFDQKIRYWEATSGICTKSIRFGESQINKLQISRDKLLVAAGGNPNIQLYDTNSNNDNSYQILEGHTQNVSDLGFQRDGKWIYSCSEDGNIKIWDIRTPTCSLSIDTRYSLNTIALNTNEVDIITGDQNGCVKVWDLRTTLCRYEHTPLSEVPIRSLSLSQDGNLLAVGSHKGKVFLYRPSNNKGKEWLLDYQYQAHENYLLKCLISPDHCTIATTSADHTIKLWKYLPTNSSPSSGIDSTLGSSNVTGNNNNNNNNNNNVNSSNITLTKCLTSHQRWVWDAVFSADSSYMVSASSDLSAKLWDIRSGEIIRNYLGHTLAVCSVALNDNNI